jgi:hypothetical protein
VAPRTYDFDANRAETEGKGPVMRAFGEDVQLPPSLPARIPLMWERARLDPEAAGQELTLSAMLRLLGTLVGADRVERWLDDPTRPLGDDEVVDLIRRATALYSPAPDPDDLVEDDDEGEAEAPKTGASDG